MTSTIKMPRITSKDVDLRDVRFNDMEDGIYYAFIPNVLPSDDTTATSISWLTGSWYPGIYFTFNGKNLCVSSHAQRNMNATIRICYEYI